MLKLSMVYGQFKYFRAKLAVDREMKNKDWVNSFYWHGESNTF